MNDPDANHVEDGMSATELSLLGAVFVIIVGWGALLLVMTP